MGIYFLCFIHSSRGQNLLPSSSEWLVLAAGWAEHLLPLPVGSAAAVRRSLTFRKESNPREADTPRLLFETREGSALQIKAEIF